jgi:hypothetical protein
MLPPVLAERGTQDPSDLQTMGGARSTRAVGVSQAALLGLEEEVKESRCRPSGGRVVSQMLGICGAGGFQRWCN